MNEQAFAAVPDPIPLTEVEQILGLLGLRLHREHQEIVDFVTAKAWIREWGISSPDRLDHVMEELRERFGIMRESVPGQLGFPHVTLKEFYAASGLIDTGVTAEQVVSLCTEEPGRWDQVVVFYVGLQPVSIALEVVRRLLEVGTPAAILLAGESTIESTLPGDARYSDVVGKLTSELRLLVKNNDASASELRHARQLLNDVR